MTTNVRKQPKNVAPAPRSKSAASRKKKTTNTAPLTPIRQPPIIIHQDRSGKFHPTRASLNQAYEKKWINGTTLHFYFFNRNSDGPDGGWTGSAAQTACVRRAIAHWMDTGIGLEFQEVSNREEAEIRIGFWNAEETWSFMGRDAIDIAGDPNERTMNFSVGLTTKSGWNKTLAEIGRALGFSLADQEHARPLDWDKITEIAQHVYPPMKSLVETELKPLESMALGVSPGEQRDVRIRPPLSRHYTIQIVGQSDVVMVLFEDVGGLGLFEEMDRELEFVAGDDNSGENRPACIGARLYRDREYVLRIRLHYSSFRNGTAILLS
ncbi:MAG: hypothetical protein HOM58_16195 [Rhodospirillaceae bacterium]|nr:hypothetical protein [Rhodospirillaceae bacterium]MBT5457876.1 hypothetical protein [Rhodospirillaceae bacterium]